MPSFTTFDLGGCTLIEWNFLEFRNLAKFRGYPNGLKEKFQAGSIIVEGKKLPLQWELELQLRTRNSLPTGPKYNRVAPKTSLPSSDKIFLHLCLKPLNVDDHTVYLKCNVQTKFFTESGKLAIYKDELFCTLDETNSSEYVFEFNIFGSKERSFLESFGFGDGSREVTFKEGLMQMRQYNNMLFMSVELQAADDPQEINFR